MDAEEETGQHLTDDIMTLVSIEEVLECAEEEEKEEHKDIGLTEGSEFISGCISFLEQTAPNSTEEDVELCQTTLEYLWRMKKMVAKRKAREFQQKKMTDFFSM